MSADPTSSAQAPEQPDVDLRLRRALPEDSAAVGHVHLTARAAATPHMPPLTRPPEEVLGWVRQGLLAEAAAGEHGKGSGGTGPRESGRSETWVAEDEGGVVGYLMLHGDWLHSLYVLPDRQGGGIGSALLDLARSLRPDGFSLWVFESNEPARAFYAHRGLVELEATLGTENEEQAPDLRMAWPGRDPLAFLRGLVDEVDTELARLLARRTALTAAIQRHKAQAGSGDGRRDPEREEAIVDRMAREAPVLGRERLSRIVHTIISESLDAASSSPLRSES